jgi:hypothetical protein
MRKPILPTLLLMLPLAIPAATLTLRDGSVIYGQFLDGNSSTITFQDESGARRHFNLTEVRSLDFDSNRSARGYNPYDKRPNNSYQQQENNSANRSYDDSIYHGEPTRGAFATLPVGTEVSVRTDNTIDSRNAAEGRLYSASIVNDVTDPSGRMMIPRGSEAHLVIRHVGEGSTLGSGALVLDLDSVRVNGRTYFVSTTDLKANGDRGIGANRRTGEMVGGGAVLGTLLGAIAGGGKGAAIGAIAGAAAGGGAQVLTKGNEIRVPAETVLNFRLDQPLDLRENR